MSESFTEKSSEIISNAASAEITSSSSLFTTTSGASSPKDWKFWAAVIVPSVAIAGLTYYYLTSTSDSDKSQKPDSPATKSKKSRSKSKKKKSKGAVSALKAEELEIDASRASFSPEIKEDATASLNISDSELAALKDSEKKSTAQNLKAIGNKLFNNKQFDEAIEYYTGALRYCEDSVFYANRAACYEALKMHDQVIKDCSAALKINKTYAKALMRRAKAYEMQENYKDSLYDFTVTAIIEKFKNVVATESSERVIKKLAEKEAKEIMMPRVPSNSFISGYFNSFTSLANLATPASEDQPLSQAEQDFNEAINLADAKKYATSIEKLQKSIDDGIESVNLAAAADAYSLRGVFNFLKGSSDLANKDFELTLKIDPNHALTLYRKSNMLAEIKQLDEAMELLDQAIALNSNDAQGYFHKGQIYFLKTDYHNSSLMYKKAIELNDDYVYPYIQSGVSLFKLGQISEANSVFESAINKFPTRSDLLNYYGEILAENGRTAEATKYFDKSIEIDSNNPLPYVNKALTVFQSSDKVDNAFSLINQALTVDPECELAIAALSQIYLQLGLFEDTMRMLDRAVELAKSEDELVSTITFRETTSAQYRFIKEYPEMLGNFEYAR
ncbi:hypothetical protein BB561_003136 [Smittium simulii]|uniref:Mitochondrial import receptor subunit TOM70 n=1 Tax=Smittium simulii TaxID=133385 RepID=A0A2T9YMU9_9FUNG|nr:hypothetical protein BB561_003136 [Smittium simulii]